MKIAVLGAGALGTIIGGLMTENGYNVDLIDVNQENINALNQNGAKMTGFLDKSIPVNAIHSQDINENYNIVFLLTKQVYTKPALESILPFLYQDSIVCTLQNGVPEELVASIVGEKRTVGGSVGFGATWIKPGVSKLTTQEHIMKKYAFAIGELSGEITGQITKVKDVLQIVGHAEITNNIEGIKWSKLLMNCMLSGMSTALGCNFGEVLDQKEALKCVAYVADEIVTVAKEHGIHLEEMQGEDFRKFQITEKECAEEKFPIFRRIWEVHRDLKASMLQDLEKGRKTEINYINGFISEKARELNINTPFNNMICKLIRQAENSGVIPNFDENLAKFHSLLYDMEKAEK